MRSFRLALVAFLLGAVAADDDEADREAALFDEEDQGDYHSGFGDGGDDDGEVMTKVYILEHGFLDKDSEWLPRGTLLLSGSKGRGFEARLSDAQEFVQLRPELSARMARSADGSHYYAVRAYDPESPKRTLQASIPAKLLANHFEDWHDILEVTVGASGSPVSLAYRVRHTLGLALFEHTQVHISEPFKAEGPRVQPAVRRPDGSAGPAPKPQEPPGMMGMLRRYWWVVLIGMVLLSNAGDEPQGKASGGKASGGGARRA